MKINILFEDNHILVVQKPQGFLTQGAITNEANLVDELKQYLKQKYNKPGNAYLGLVHRLDRGVGGVMVFAKTSKAASRLSLQIREHIFQKTYLAVVHSEPLDKANILVDYLKKDHNLNKVSIVKENIEGAQRAELSYDIIEKSKQTSLLKINLKTGRPHQIRVQFASRNCPIVGDTKYGSDLKEDIALWAYLLKLSHPITKETLEFKSYPPMDKFPWSIYAKKIQSL
jgi:23S rRNA pseudouridine1911/1915/1917 synthase